MRIQKFITVPENDCNLLISSQSIITQHIVDFFTYSRFGATHSDMQGVEIYFYILRQCCNRPALGSIMFVPSGL
jgi:hypothetical protein